MALRPRGISPRQRAACAAWRRGSRGIAEGDGGHHLVFPSEPLVQLEIGVLHIGNPQRPDAEGLRREEHVLDRRPDRLDVGELHPDLVCLPRKLRVHPVRVVHEDRDRCLSHAVGCPAGAPDVLSARLAGIEPRSHHAHHFVSP